MRNTPRIGKIGQQSRLPLPGEAQGFLENLINGNGPRPQEFGALNACLDSLNRLRESGSISLPQLRAGLFQLGGPFATTESLIGHVLANRNHGDYWTIDSIYQNRVADTAELRRWDSWFQALPAADAVRNRKTFFIEYLKKLAKSRPEGRVLILGSGSCRDVCEYLEVGPGSLSFDCVDTDPRAIAFATDLCRKHDGQFQFFRDNVLLFRPDESYDLVASLGLFDYFRSSLFIKMLRRSLNLITPGGKILIGNFGVNPSRGVMACAGWRLYERSAEELLKLSRMAGIAAQQSWVASEESGVNLFLEIRRAEEG